MSRTLIEEVEVAVALRLWVWERYEVVASSSLRTVRPSQSHLRRKKNNGLDSML